MTSPSHLDGPDPQPDAGLAKGLEAWRPPGARPAFREELRERFLAGESVTPVDEVSHPTAPRPAPGPGRLVRGEELPGGRGRKGPGWFPYAAAAGLAAALLLYFLGPGSDTPRGVEPDPHGLAWTVLDGSGGEGLTVDGARFSVSEPAALLAALAPGSLVETDGETLLRLKLDRRLVFELGPDTRVRLAALTTDSTVPGSLRLDAEHGGLRIVTGPGFAGSSLSVGTPDALVSVIGTEFAVDIDPQGTCVCCTAGTVEVQPVGGSAQGTPISAGEMRYVFRDPAKQPMPGAVMPDHVPPITNLRRYWP